MTKADPTSRIKKKLNTSEPGLDCTAAVKQKLEPHNAPKPKVGNRRRYLNWRIFADTREASAQTCLSAHIALSPWHRAQGQRAWRPPQLLRGVPGQRMSNLVPNHGRQQVLVTIQQLDQACQWLHSKLG